MCYVQDRHPMQGVLCGPGQLAEFCSLALTNIVVTMSVLLARVSDTLRSREVQFIVSVLLEYQIPICKRGEAQAVQLTWQKKTETPTTQKIC